MATAKAAGRVPRELAGDLVERLNAAPPAHVERVEIAGPGFVNFHLGRRGSTTCSSTWSRVARTATPASTSGVAGGSTSSSCRPTPPARSTPATAAGRAFGDSLCRILERTGHVVHREYYLNDRGAQMGIFGASLVGAEGGHGAARGRLPGRVHHASGRRRCPTTPTRRSGATSGPSATSGRALARIGVEFDTWSASRRWSTPARSTPPSPTSAQRGVVFEEDGATWLRTTDFGDDKDRVARQVRTASPPTSCPTSPTTATSSTAASTCSSTSGAPTTTATWRASRRASRRSATSPTSSRSSSASWCSLVRGGEEVRLSKRAGDIVAARRPRRRGRPGRRPPHVPPPVDRHPADHRPRPDHVAVEREPGLLRAVRQRPDPLDRPQGRRGRHRAAPARRGRPVAARARARARAAPHARRAARGAGRSPAPTGRRTRSPPGSASWPTGSTASTTTAT